MSPQDLLKGIDLTGLTSVNASQLNQLVDNASPADSRGLVVVTTDTAVNTPEVPDGVVNTKYQRYLWIRRRHSSDPSKDALVYFWNDNALLDVTLQRWELVNEAQSLSAALGALNAAIAAYFVANPVEVDQDNSDFTTKEQAFPVYEIYSKSRPVDPRAFGADPDGLVSSNAAIRRAIFAAAAGDKIVEFTPGTYLITEDISYDSVDESTPYLHGTSYVYRDGWYAQIPLLDNIVLTAKGQATLKLAQRNTDTRIITALGRENVIIENLIFDGNLSDQPNRGAGMGYLGGYGDNAVLLGNQAIFRFNTVKNFVGQIFNQSGYYPQTDMSPSEPFAVLVGSFCQVYGNTLKQNFNAGFAIYGQFSEVFDNVVEDTLGVNAGFYAHQAANAGNISSGGALDYRTVIFHKLNRLGYYKGIKLGSIIATTDGYFYATDMTDAALHAIWGGVSSVPSDQDKSVRQYYSFANRLTNNVFRRFGSIAVNMESCCAETVRGNKFYQGVPVLDKYSNVVAVKYKDTVSGQESVLRLPGASFIKIANPCIDPVIEDNEFHISLHEVPTSATDTVESQPIDAQGLAMAPGGHLDNTAGYAQTEVFTTQIKRNKVFSNSRATGEVQTFGSGWGSGYPVSFTSVPSGAALLSCEQFQSNITEYEVDFGPEYQVASPVVLAVRGKFKFHNPVGQYSHEYYDMVPTSETGAGSSGNFNWIGTRQRPFKTFLMKSGNLWKLSYNFYVTYGTTLYAQQKGSIRLKHSSGTLELFDHDVEELSYLYGAFEFQALANLITPGNTHRIVNNRVFPTMYRGGLKVFFNPFDQTLFGMKNDGTYAYNSNLTFHAEGELTC